MPFGPPITNRRKDKDQKPENHITDPLGNPQDLDRSAPFRKHCKEESGRQNAERSSAREQRDSKRVESIPRRKSREETPLVGQNLYRTRDSSNGARNDHGPNDRFLSIH